MWIPVALVAAPVSGLAAGDVSGIDATQLGVSGVVVVILLVGIRVLWIENQKLRAESREDQKLILPALTQATASVTEAARAIERVTRLYEREPRNKGDT